MSRKLSIDLTDENADALEKIKKEAHVAYGRLINTLIELFCRNPLDINTELLAFCKEKLKEHYNEINNAGEYETQMLINKCQVYENLAIFFNHGHSVDCGRIEIKPKMQEIEMQNGILICPFDYIILNKEAAGQCEYASVVEVKNAPFGVPHFIFFHSRKADTYTNDDKKAIERACIREWPTFQLIIDNLKNSGLASAVEDNKQLLKIKNEDVRSPEIGYFPIAIQEGSDGINNIQSPLGIKIIRINKDNN